MKKLIICMAMACVVLAGCSKENTKGTGTEEAKAKALLENVQGKWTSISFTSYNDDEDYKNDKPRIHQEYEPNSNGREVFKIEGDMIFFGVNVKQQLLLDVPARIESNDGKQIQSEKFIIQAEGGGEQYFTVEYLDGDRLKVTKRPFGPSILSVQVYVCVRTDLEEMEVI